MSPSEKLPVRDGEAGVIRLRLRDPGAAKEAVRG